MVIAVSHLISTLQCNRPGRTRTCSPRFWSPLLATPALQRLLIFNDLALGQQRRRCWTPPALRLILTLTRAARRIRRLDWSSNRCTAAGTHEKRKNGKRERR